MMNNNPIGIFDSGIGGTSIFKAIHHLLPNESITYLADSKNAPYGLRSKAEILEFSIKNTELLLRKKCKIIVVACNTATTNAIAELRFKYDVPFIGIEPAIKPASLKTKTKSIGILATQGTLSSSLFHKTLNLYSENIKVVEQEGRGIVELIEAGKLESEEMKLLLKMYLQPMIKANIDHLVLGCTHYPYLIPALKKIIPKNIKIIDSGAAVARQTKAILEQNNLLNISQSTPKISFYSNGKIEVLSQILNQKFNVAHLDF